MTTIIQHSPEATPTRTSLDAAIIVALGSNLPGERASPLEVLEAALSCLSTHGLTVVKRSRWWRSAAWPNPAEPVYVNGVVWIAPPTAGSGGEAPEALLRELQAIEDHFGRLRGGLNAARVLDLDLIAFGRACLRTPTLTLPHPRAAERAFVMGPICDLDPAWRHPESGATAATLLARAIVGLDAHPLAPSDSANG